MGFPATERKNAAREKKLATSEEKIKINKKEGRKKNSRDDLKNSTPGSWTHFQKDKGIKTGEEKEKHGKGDLKKRI